MCIFSLNNLNFYLSELNCLLWGFLARISFINCGTWYPEQAHFWSLANFFLVFALICYLSCHAVLHQTRLPVANWQQNHGNLEINFCRQGSKVPSLKKRTGKFVPIFSIYWGLKIYILFWILVPSDKLTKFNFWCTWTAAAVMNHKYGKAFAIYLCSKSDPL